MADNLMINENRSGQISWPCALMALSFGEGRGEAFSESIARIDALYLSMTNGRDITDDKQLDNVRMIWGFEKVLYENGFLQMHQLFICKASPGFVVFQYKIVSPFTNKNAQVALLHQLQQR